MDNSVISIIGLWHLGCVNAVGFSELGYKVIGIDFDSSIIEKLKRGIPAISEPFLENLIKKNLSQGKLEFSADFENSLPKSKYVVISFDTKIDEEDKVDLTDVFRSVDIISKICDDGTIVIVRSQVPVGTCRKISEVFKNRGKNIEVVYNPENLRLGSAVSNFSSPEFIVIGSQNKNAAQEVESLYSKINCKKIHVGLETAEMLKHALNSFIATTISFANEISDVCEKVGVDATKISEIMKLDNRVGANARINPGFGFSGGTLARDIQVLRELGNENDVETHILDAIMKVNKNRIAMVIQKLENEVGSLNGKKIAVLGLTYKSGTDTLRRSLPMELVDILNKQNVLVRAFDPMVKNNIGEIEIFKTPYEAAENCDAIVLLTAWPEFKDLDIQKLKEVSKSNMFFDTQNFLDPEKFKKSKFRYIGVGR
jgi:UDPglucose 6-dehydrogenase